jgi:Uma2 family endonuclease
MVDTSVKPYVTFADYLEAEQSSDVKHEWFNGSVYAMSRGTPEHARLSASVIVLVGSALPRGCVVYTGDLMLYVEEVKLSTYADASVVCGPLETITVKRSGRSLGEGVTNPVVIVEVLSESTERYDREEKFSYYRTLPSLQEFVLVSQDEVAIEVFRRPAAGQGRGSSPPFPDPVGGWTRERAGAGGTVTIHGCTIEVDAVYDTRA